MATFESSAAYRSSSHAATACRLRRLTATTTGTSRASPALIAEPFGDGSTSRRRSWDPPHGARREAHLTGPRAGPPDGQDGVVRHGDDTRGVVVLPAVR